jgi:hypothetical protein
MTAGLGIMIAPIPHGWAVYLTNGRELARYFGIGARYRALRRARQAARQGS